MRALSAAELVEVWEHGAQAHPLVRPLLMVAAGFPEEAAATLVQEPLGSLNARLWELRTALIGNEVVGCVECPSCGERVELEVDSGDLAQSGAAPSSPPVRDASVRPLTLTDLHAAAEQPDPAAVLIERCVPSGRRAVAGGEVSAALAAADPGAELLLEVGCPGCGHGWAAPLDIGSYLWAELDRMVGDTVRDVDLLARCYGWSERDVLGMSPTRRRRYVELATGAEVTGR